MGALEALKSILEGKTVEDRFGYYFRYNSNINRLETSADRGGIGIYP